MTAFALYPQYQGSNTVRFNMCLCKEPVVLGAGHGDQSRCPVLCAVFERLEVGLGVRDLSPAGWGCTPAFPITLTLLGPLRLGEVVGT